MLVPDLIAKLNHCATSDLAGPRDFWFSWLARFTTMVAVGLALELPELAYELKLIARAWIPYFRYRIITPSDRRLQTAKVVAFIGWILIVAGVVGERYAEVRVKDFDASIQECSDVKLAEVTEEAGGAKMSAEGAARAASRADTAAGNAQQTVGKVAKQAGALTARMETASRNLGVLEQDIRAQGPRWRLLEDGKEDFIGALKPFERQLVLVMYCGRIETIAPEPYRVVQDLANFLGNNQGSGWDVRLENWDSCSSEGANIGGILVLTSPAANATVKEAAMALNDALNKIEISADFSQTALTLRGFFGPESPWERAAKDPTLIVLLVEDNPMSDLIGRKKRHK